MELSHITTLGQLYLCFGAMKQFVATAVSCAEVGTPLAQPVLCRKFRSRALPIGLPGLPVLAWANMKLFEIFWTDLEIISDPLGSELYSISHKWLFVALYNKCEMFRDLVRRRCCKPPFLWRRLHCDERRYDSRFKLPVIGSCHSAARRYRVDGELETTTVLFASFVIRLQVEKSIELRWQ